MKKLFIKFSMMLFVLGMSTNTVWADMQGMLEGLQESNPELAQQLATTLSAPTYCAQLTGHASSTGGGKVYVNTSSTDDPRGNEYVEGTSNVAVNGMGMSMAGMTKIGITAWAKPDPGYYLAGWSYSNTGTDLGVQSNGQPEGVYLALYDIGIHKNETIKHVIYGTFEPIRIAGYEFSGNTTTSDDGNGNMVCDLAVIFTPSGAAVDIDAGDFKYPVVSGDGWSLTNWDYNISNAGKVTVNVHFTTSNTNAADYSGTAVLETKAGVKMTANLNARTAASSAIEAIRYNKNKVKQGEGTLAEMIAAAAPTDVIKLNKNYEGQVVATKSFTLDLNGYNLTYNFNEVVANYSTPQGQVHKDRIAQAAILVNKADAVVTLAYSPYGGKVVAGPYNDAVDVLAGKLVLNGGNLTGFFGIGSMGGDVVQNGATIIASEITQTAVACMGGDYTMTDGKIYGLFGSMGGVSAATVTINGGTIDNTEQTIEGVSLSGGVGVQIGTNSTAWIRKGTILAKTFGVQSTTIPAGGDITIEKLAVIKGGSYALDCGGGTTTVNCGKFEDPAKLWHSNSGNAVFVSGYFQTNNQGEDEYWGEHVWRNTSGAEFREGYEFFVGPSESAKAAGVSVCHIGGVSYSSLEDALAYANNTSEPVVIIMDNDYILPAGYYTLPSNATLLIPKSNDQAAVTSVVERESSYTRPSMFRKLTLLDGANLDVFGTIEVSGTQYSALSARTGSVTGPYAMLQMNAGSKVTLQNNSHLYAWGYVAGDVELKNTTTHVVPMGEIDARRGATIHEMFQMGDWGNTMQNAFGLVTNDSRFPINAYFVQNIEVPTKYHAGARLTAATSVSADLNNAHIMMCANDIQIIGVTKVDVAIFLMDQEADEENTWVRKWYDASKDQQVYEINSAAHIGSLVINLASSPLLNNLEQTLASGAFGEQMQGIGQLAQGAGAHFEQDLVMNSGQYVLPITYNFKLHLLSGTLDFTQNTALIPSSELEIDKEAKVYVTDQNTPGVLEGSLYIYDASDWSNSAAQVAYSPSFDDGVNNGSIPSSVRDASALEDAIVNVHGTFDTAQGYIFTSETGGNIFSSVEDAGTFMFTEAAKAADYSEEVKVTTSENKNFYSAWLRNSDEYVTAKGGDESQYRYAKTGGTVAGKSYCYVDFDGNGGQWKSLTIDGCFIKDDTDPIHPVYYIKPQEYVAVASNVEDPTTHTYSDLAGAGRLFILLTDDDDNCTQWWEVEAKDNYYHCIHPENDTYYEWDSSKNKWVEKKFTITWKDWDGSLISTYSVSYGTQAEWLSSNPTREKNVDYTYDFTGWSPALGKVTSDVTYTATYEAKQIKYTITFEQEGGVEIERHLLARDEVPVCENTPTRTGYILQWEPGIEPVVGNQTYTATWLPEPPDTFMVTFKNYDGTEILKYTGTGEHPAVEAGVAPTPPAADPSKPQTDEYTYAFTGWKGPKGFTAKNETLPVATENATYVAQYSENARTYEINFYDENGSGVLKSENLKWGATPTPPAVSKTKTGYTYTYVWQNKDDATKAIESVKGDANYKPVFTETPNKYTVTLQCNLPGKATFTGAGLYDYGTSATIAANPANGYEFVKWQERAGDADLGSVEVNGDITLTAVVKESDKSDPEDLTVGINGSQTVASATDYMDVTLTSDGVAHSSQIINANNITLYGNADFVLSKTFASRTWYCVAVPWRVEANGGIYIDNSTTPAVLGTDIEICYYDGAVRAAQGKVPACWVYMKNLSTKKILEPGRAYMIALLRTSATQITFRKKVQEPILTTGTSVQEYPSATATDAGWNAIANPSLFHAFVNAGSTEDKAQRYNSADDSYEWFGLDEHKLVVGEPIYVQAPAAKSIVVANGASYAPVRRAKAQAIPAKYEVSVKAAGATKYADHLSITLNEDKEEDQYIIGQDLVKFGVSTKVAQMWINRYDAKLCVNAVAPEEDATSFPMSLFAPKAGDYTIAIEREVATEDYALYLTYNGEAIWNLSDGAYVANLSKGTDANYGLRISAKAPQTATGMDEAVVDSKDAAAYKVLINNQVFIIRGEKIYSMDGQLIK